MAETEQKEYPMIYRSIAGVIADVGAVGKDKMNKQQGFKFRSIDDVYNALHPALAKNKVVIVPDILEREVEKLQTAKGTLMHHVTCTIKFTFYAEDGSSIESTLVGEALDTGDKATNKAMAIAYKYACFQVFCIPTSDMADPDVETVNGLQTARRRPSRQRIHQRLICEPAESTVRCCGDCKESWQEPACRRCRSTIHSRSEKSVI